MTFVKVNPRRRRKRRNTIFTTPAFQHLVNDLVNTSVGNIIDDEYVKTKPPVNVIETKDSFRLELAAPGLTKKDITINVEKDILKVEAKKEVKENEEQNFTRKEFNYSSFERTFKLNDKIDPANINASFNNGILVLDLAKKEEAKELPPRSINIK